MMELWARRHHHEAAVAAPPSRRAFRSSFLAIDALCYIVAYNNGRRRPWEEEGSRRRRRGEIITIRQSLSCVCDVIDGMVSGMIRLWSRGRWIDSEDEVVSVGTRRLGFGEAGRRRLPRREARSSIQPPAPPRRQLGLLIKPAVDRLKSFGARTGVVNHPFSCGVWSDGPDSRLD